MSISPESVVEAARYFEAHDERQRIHKLLFCLSKKYWENDPQIINHQSVENLLIELTQLKPNIEQLADSLSKIVNTLNCPDVYSAIAKIILQRMKLVYAGHTNVGMGAEGRAADLPPQGQLNFSQVQRSDKHQIVSEPVISAGGSQCLAEQIATALSKHPEKVRIKKLIFAVTKGYWENNLQVIHAVEFPQLILALKQQHTSQQELYISFGRVVNSINKTKRYAAIAKLVIQQMTRLYENEDETTQTDISGLISSMPTLIAEPEPTVAITQQKNDQRQPPNADIDSISSAFPPKSSPVNSKSTVMSIDAPDLPGAQLNQLKPYDSFELRTEIMQYTNPLRAKVLLFSVLFQSDESAQDWGMIRRYGLDDLVEQLLLSCQHPNDLEVKLTRQAQRMDSQEDYLQTAQALIKILKSRL